jgi:arylsulfatase A-like enzyme
MWWFTLASCAEIDTGVAPEADTDTDSDSDTDTDTDTDTDVADGLAGLDDLGVKNVVFIHVDTLRADRLPTYGYSRDTLPDARQLPWLVVDNYTSMDSWTLPSTTTMITSLEPSTHGVTHLDESFQPSTDLSALTLAQHLSDNGWATYGGSGNTVLQSTNFLSYGFDETSNPDAPGAQSNLDYLLSTSLQWLDRQPDGQPFFIFLQPMDVHGPYRPGDYAGTWSNAEDLPFALTDPDETQVRKFEEAYRTATEDERRTMFAAIGDVYDESILNLDDAIVRARGELGNRGLSDDTLLIVTSDHGEAFGEDNLHPWWGHGGTTRPEVTHIPLMFNNVRLADQAVGCLSQNTDIGPTVVQLLGLPPMDGVDGVALQDGCRPFIRSSSYKTDTDRNATVEMMVSDGAAMLRWSCDHSTEEYYDLSTDRAAASPVDPATLSDVTLLQDEMASFEALLQSQGVEPCVVE